MDSLLTDSTFLADYEKLKDVKLNPSRHLARTAYDHCEMVASRVLQLASLNRCSDEETRLLHNLALAHDIGKIAGTANPDRSVELLPRYHVSDASFIELVKYHDTNLPWFVSHERGQPPSDKAWRKLASKVNVRLLCLFMVADRVDCPGGWRTNRPLVWFLEQVQARNLLDRELVLDDGPTGATTGQPVIEVSAGAALIRRSPIDIELLLIRVRSDGYELPKGHLEWDETPEATAARELREETGLVSATMAGEPLGTLEYAFEQEGVTVHKRVHYFLFTATEPLAFGEKPSRTNELRWIRQQEAETLPLVSGDLRPLILKAFDAFTSHPSSP